MKYLFSALFLFSITAEAVTFSYSDPACVDFTMASGVITCVKTTTTPKPPPPPVVQGNCAQVFAGQATNNTNTVLDFSRTGLNNKMVVSRGQSRSIQIDTSVATAGRTGYFITASDTIGASVPMFMNVSTAQCDFSYSNYDTSTGCASSGTTLRVDYSVGTTPVAGKCTLLPNTTYYINIRDEKLYTDRTGVSFRGSNTCAAGQTCGFVFQTQ